MHNRKHLANTDVPVRRAAAQDASDGHAERRDGAVRWGVERGEAYGAYGGARGDVSWLVAEPA